MNRENHKVCKKILYREKRINILLKSLKNRPDVKYVILFILVYISVGRQ